MSLSVTNTGLLQRVAVAALLIAASSCIAQTDGNDLSKMSDAYPAYEKLLKEWADTKDPAKAAAAFDKFVRDHPKMDMYTLTPAGHATIKYFLEAKNPEKALEIADYVAATMNAGNFSNDVQFISRKAEILSLMDRPAEVEKTVKDNWKKMVASPFTAASGFKQYISAIKKQGRRDDAIEQMRRLMLDYPELLDDENQGDNGWLYNQLISDLTATGQDDDALGWARLRFMVCNFNDAAIGRASNGLMRVWVAKNLNQNTSQAFMAAQKDPAQPNPLAEVKLPALDAAAKKALLAKVQGIGVPAHTRVSAYIALGMPGDAMGAARQSLVEEVGGAGGAQEVCRVFKAADLNMVRANAFVQYFQSGKGTNPLQEFMAKNPPTG